MASTTPFLRFVSSLLLLLLPSALREYVPTASNLRPVNDDGERHPIVLVPGGSCSELEARLTDAYRPSAPHCGAMKGKGWFGLWQNSSELTAHDYVPCFMEQMSLVYDPAANDYRNTPGVDMRVRNFGASTGFYSNPGHPDWCLYTLSRELERIGYRDGHTLFGAPYDLRLVPPIPGQPSRFYSRYFRQLMALVQDASRKNKHRKVILFGHSYGGTVALAFVRAMPLAWRHRYIQHLFLVAPLPDAGGSVGPVRNFVSGTGFIQFPGAAPLHLRPMWRTLETALASFPSAAVFGADVPLVITARRNYTARDVEELLADLGAGDVVEPFRRRQLPRMRYFEAPMVPVTCVNGVGNETPEQLVYWDGDFDAAPEIVYGDGDGAINLVSMLAFDEEMRRQPGQRERFKSIKLPGATHGTIATEEWSRNVIIQEILEASNRI